MSKLHIKKLELEEDLYLKILQCEEYASYLLFKKDEYNKIYINIAEIPKISYLTINGDYTAGFIMAGKINEVVEDIKVKVEVVEDIKVKVKVKVDLIKLILFVYKQVRRHYPE